jgi:protein-arginine kinase activator protein McsA
MGLMYYKHVELKYKKKQKTNVAKYKCPICGAGLDENRYQIQVITKDIVWFCCSNCYSSGNSKLEDVINKPIIAEKISNKDSIKDWDLKSAKDVEFTKVTESFNRKSELD